MFSAQFADRFDFVKNSEFRRRVEPPQPPLSTPLPDTQISLYFQRLY